MDDKMIQGLISGVVGPDVQMHGYSSLPAHSILERLEAGTSIADIDGDFVISGALYGSAFLVSSFLSCAPYYYAVSDKGELVHGTHAFDVAKRAGQPWNWNQQALVSLAAYGHTLNDDSLCDTVSRMPPASRLEFRGGMVHIERLAVPAVCWDREDDWKGCFNNLVRAFRASLSGADCVDVSLSAGYDSRLLLALTLHEGVRFRLSVMGSQESTDVRVAQRICARVGSPLQVIEIDASSYVSQGARISWETSGVKTALNWHTFIYANALGSGDGVHLVGSNGEFARSFYFDKPVLNRLMSLAPASAMPLYWRARAIRRIWKFSRFNPLLQEVRQAPQSLPAVSVGQRWGVKSAASALDASYAEQRVRHFIGSGLACYRAVGNPRSPFMDSRWIRSCAAMKRRFKLGNEFHRRAIGELDPRLLKDRFNVDPESPRQVGYNPFPSFVNNALIKELILDSRQLDVWTSRAQRAAILDDPKCSQMEERNFWLTLHFAAEAAASGSRESVGGSPLDNDRP